MDRRLGVFLTTAILLCVTFFVVVLPREFHLPVVSASFIVLLSLPSFGVAIKSGVTRGVLAVLALGVFSLMIESVGIITGFPYGPFRYGDAIGFKLGVVPWTVFFAWPPLVFGAWVLAKRWSKKHALLLAPLLLVIVDLVLDPVNTALGFWVWAHDGFYYGVPLLNFFGWLVSGTIGVLIAWAFFPEGLPVGASYSLFLTLLFATCASLWLGYWVPLIIGVASLVFIYQKSLPVRLRQGFRT